MILIIDDDIAVRTSLELLLRNEGYEVATADGEEEALSFIKKHKPQLIILDLNFSIDTSGREGLSLLEKIKERDKTIPVILITGWGTIELAVAGMKMGANDFLSKPWSNDYVLQTVQTLVHLTKPKPTGHSRNRLDELYNFQQIIGEHPSILDILNTVGRVAATDASILLLGESGTGKELIAEAIHRNSSRAAKPFVKVNLGGISSSLFESEMFGHVRGAFTDAKTDRIGRFELANKGTIFLDEIGDLDAASQVKLLRVLQDRTYEVLGSSRTKTADVRVVCATNKNLEELVSSGHFREDLLYRINLITLKIPPLRQRVSDIPHLVNFFLSNLRLIYNRPNVQVSDDVMRWLKELALPGNIRQLKNMVERAFLLSAHDQLTVADFKLLVQQDSHSKGSVQLPEVGSVSLDELEDQMIRRTMTFYQNKISRAAQALGITRSSLYRRLAKYNIPYDEASD